MNQLIDLLRQPGSDPAVNLVWALPVAAGQTLSKTEISPRPMYPFRKLVAKSRGSKTSELPPILLSALNEIEQRVGGYHWAFAATYDAWQMGRMRRDTSYQPKTHPQELAMHKLKLLLGCFPNLDVDTSIEILIFAGEAICEHPAMYKRGSTAAEVDKGVLRVPRDRWDSVAYLDFMRGVWLVRQKPDVQPFSLTPTRFKSIWDSVFSYSFTTFEQDFEVEGFRHALAAQLE